MVNANILWARLRAAATRAVEGSEEEQTRQARLLRTILRASLVTTGLAVVIPVFLTRPIPVPTLLIIGLAFVLQMASMWLLDQRRPRAASLLMSVVGWGLITLTAYIFGGLDDPSYNAYIIVILIAGLLLGGRAATTFALLSIFTGLGLLLAGNLGWLPVPVRVVTPAQRWATGTAVLFLSAVLLRLAIGSLEEALARARRNEQAQIEANKELRAIQASLEERVKARTRELQESHSELEQAYRALKDNQQRMLISEKMASLGRLTAGIAHEINTPIAAVRAALAQVESLAREYEASIGDGQVTETDHHQIAKEMAASLAIAATAAERAAAFVHSVKSQTRDMAEVQSGTFNVAEVIDGAVVLLSHAVRKSGCEVRFDPPDQPIELYGPRGRLSQVITNLLSNAIDASVGRPGLPIDIQLARSNGSVLIKVADHGCGIKPADLPRVFDPLFTTKSFGDGTGLGLTIVHDIVHGDFGGQIDVESEVGTGSTFTVAVPARGGPLGS